MNERRWWDIVVPLVAAAIATPIVILQGPGDAVLSVLALVAVVVFVLDYALIGRPLLSRSASVVAPWRRAIFIAVMALSLAVGVYAAPFLAMLQTIAYPMVWVATDSRRGGLSGTVAIGAGVFFGFWIRGGLSWTAFWEGLLSGGLAVVFAASLGLWITSIAEYGEERARLVTELTAAQGEIESLSRDRGAVAERERIARDIHDTLAQTLAGLVLLSERAGRQVRDGRADAAAETVAVIEQTAREALSESRALVARMAAVPADAALAASVERLAARFRAEAGLSISVAVAPGVDLDRDRQVVLLRSLQEALANVRKHAEAREVAIVVAADGEDVVMTVRDDGIGFDPDAARTGFGLDGITDRAALAGGTVAVESAPGAGVQLVIRVPGSAHDREVEA